MTRSPHFSMASVRIKQPRKWKRGHGAYEITIRPMVTQRLIARDSRLLRPSLAGLWILLACLAATFSSNADPIEPRHPAYELLRRGEAQGLVPLGFTAILPRDRNEVVSALKTMQESNPPLLWDAQIESALRDLDWEARRQVSVLTYRDSNWVGGAQADFTTSGTYADSLPRAQAFAFGSLSLQIAGQYGEHLYAVSQAFVGSERSHVARFRENYDPSQGLTYNTDREGKAGVARGVSTFDGFRTVVGMVQGPIRLEAGQDWNQWGPGRFSQTTLGAQPWFWVQDSLPASDSVDYSGTKFSGGYRRGFRFPGEASPLPQLRLRIASAKLEYIKVVAQRTGLHADSAAWLIAHRVVWHARRDLTFGATELVALAGRNPDWVYWLPLVPLKYAEHQLGDRDNIAISADVTYRLPWCALVYAEGLLDDFSGFPLDFWGNKFAFTLGGHWESPKTAATQLDLEYSLVSPWVYSHLKPNTQMQSYGALLGSALPPDSHRILGLATQGLSATWKAMAQGYWMQRGVGSREASIFSVHLDSLDGSKRKFLEGPVESRLGLALGTQWKPLTWLDVDAWVGHAWVTDWKGQGGLDWTVPWLNGSVHVTY